MTWATKWPVSQQGEPGLRILIVEDNADSAESMACLLRHYGYEIEVASNGLTALEAVKGRHPDVVLLDIGLPDIDGWEVAKRLKETDSPKRPLIIAVTGFAQDSDRCQSELSGIDLHLTKPANPQQLEVMLRRFSQIIGD